MIYYEKGMLMAPIARIIGLSLLTAGLGVGLGYVFFGQYNWSFVGLLLACVGGIIGAIAGAAQEIVIAQRQPPSTSNAVSLIPENPSGLIAESGLDKLRQSVKPVEERKP